MLCLCNMPGVSYWISASVGCFFIGISDYILFDRFSFGAGGNGVINFILHTIHVLFCGVTGFCISPAISQMILSETGTRIYVILSVITGALLYVILDLMFGHRRKLCRVGKRRSRLFLKASLEGVFLFIFILNNLTPYVADDFVYRLSFYGDKLPITHFSDIFPSMYQHSFSMNGRVISHFFEQFFMLFPKVIFNFFNALVFVLFAYMIYRIANRGARSPRALIFLGIFAALWQYMPVFGQTVLWQVGSVNYLWGLCAALAFIIPYICYYCGRPILMCKWQRVLFCIAALPFGMYTEVASFIGIFTAVLFLIASRIMYKRKLKVWLWLPVLFASVGYRLMLLMPVQLSEKQSELLLDVLLKNFEEATSMLKTYAMPLLVLWAVFATLAYYARIPRESLVQSSIFVIGAIAANYMLIVAKYYPDRCAAMTVTLLIIANGILIAQLIETPFAPAGACYTGLLAVLCLFSILFGVYDIWNCHVEVEEREAEIAEQLENGVRDLELDIIHSSTSYSAFYGTTDLNTDTSDIWPNSQMAEYYGADSIIGIK